MLLPGGAAVVRPWTCLCAGQLVGRRAASYCAGS